MTEADALSPLRRAADALHQAELERNRWLRRLRSSRIPLTRLADAAKISLGKVHGLTKPAVIVSVGYEGRSLNDFLDLLCDAGVQCLVDVRENPISRKPGFSRSALEAGAASRGIGYVHERTLGNPKPNREAFRDGTAEGVERYRDHLAAGGEGALERVASLLQDRTVALLCFEADQAFCHRSIVSERLREMDPLVTVRAL